MVLTPNVTPLWHAGASPYAPVLTPAEQHAAQRCEPVRVTPPVVRVDVWGRVVLDDEDHLL